MVRSMNVKKTKSSKKIVLKVTMSMTEIKSWMNTEENSDQGLMMEGRSPLKEMISSY